MMRNMLENKTEIDARSFRRALLAWYRANARDMPWRRTTDPYAIWLSEIMLQQTRVDQGTPYYERFIATFPNVHALARASEDRVLKLWEGLGYYSRARNLHRAAKIVSSEYAGTFPQSAEQLQTLPGVGRYTAGAIASIAFGERVPVLDGNVIRVLSRVFNIEACTDEPKVRDQLWEIAATLVPARDPGDFNQAMMELGARVCTPNAPLCAQCPVQKHCCARAKGVESQRPVRRKKRNATPGNGRGRNQARWKIPDGQTPRIGTTWRHVGISKRRGAQWRNARARTDTRTETEFWTSHQARKTRRKRAARVLSF